MSGFVKSLFKLLQSSKKEETARESSLLFGELRTGLMGNCFRPRHLHYKWLQEGETNATLTAFSCIYLPVLSNGAEAFYREYVAKAKAEVVNPSGSVVSVHTTFLWFLTNAPRNSE